MKNLDDIKARLRGLITQELDYRVEIATRRLPARCIHNHQQELDPRSEVLDEPNPSYNRIDRRHLPVVNKIGLCMLGAENPDEWPGNICEDAIDAQRCPDFTPIQSKPELLEELLGQLKDDVWVEVNLPAVHSLLWVLDDTIANYHLPWWKQLWFRVLRIRVEPVQTRDVLKLLPAESFTDDNGD